MIMLHENQEKFKCKYDIIALSETWINEEQLKLLPIAGYRAFIQAREKRKSGGIIMYVRDEITILQHELTSIKQPAT